MPETHSILLSSIPHDTARAALSSFGDENLYIRIGNSLDVILQDLPPACLAYPLRHTATPAYVLALITVFQHQEKLTDEEMVRALRNRPEVRYGLRLAMRNPTVSTSALCRYRRLLFDDPKSFETFQKIAGRVIEFINRENGSSRKDGYSVPEAVCIHNRIDRTITAMLEVLGSLAATQPNWMREIAPSYWYERYHRSSSKFVKTLLEKDALEIIREIGNDIKYLLDLAEKEKKFADVPEIRALKLVFDENFELAPEEARLDWKPLSCTFCSRTVMQVKEAS
ncbi:MAG: transposase [Chloroflexota bacterium]